MNSAQNYSDHSLFMINIKTNKPFSLVSGTCNDQSLVTSTHSTCFLRSSFQYFMLLRFDAFILLDWTMLLLRLTNIAMIMEFPIEIYLNGLKWRIWINLDLCPFCQNHRNWHFGYSSYLLTFIGWRDVIASMVSIVWQNSLEEG